MTMNDPFGSMGGFLNQFKGFMQNPMQFFAQRKMNLPQDVMQNPQAAVQQLLNSGQMSQSQLDQLQKMAHQIAGNPQFMQMFR